MATYAWWIFRDNTEAVDIDVTGPSDADANRIAELRAGFGHLFHTLDDDGNITYTGRLHGDPSSEDGFGPLDDFAAGNAGDTGIEYQQANGAWEIL